MPAYPKQGRRTLSHLSFVSLVGFCALVAAILGAGCSSTDKGDLNALVSIVIHGHPVERVREVTAQVFRDDGYKVTRNGYAKLIFEKQGSTLNNISYGNWMGGGVWVRVKAALFEVSPNTCRIECEAFVLRGRGEALEEEIRINKLHRHPYQELLNEVSKRLSTTPGSGSPQPGVAPGSAPR
jgi:hypothetical protein